jgi:hypothetical protein
MDDLINDNKKWFYCINMYDGIIYKGYIFMDCEDIGMRNLCAIKVKISEQCFENRLVHKNFMFDNKLDIMRFCMKNSNAKNMFYLGNGTTIKVKTLFRRIKDL